MCLIQSNADSPLTQRQEPSGKKLGFARSKSDFALSFLLTLTSALTITLIDALTHPTYAESQGGGGGGQNPSNGTTGTNGAGGNGGNGALSGGGGGNGSTAKINVPPNSITNPIIIPIHGDSGSTGNTGITGGGGGGGGAGIRNNSSVIITNSGSITGGSGGDGGIGNGILGIGAFSGGGGGGGAGILSASSVTITNGGSVTGGSGGAGGSSNYVGGGGGGGSGIRVTAANTTITNSGTISGGQGGSQGSGGSYNVGAGSGIGGAGDGGTQSGTGNGNGGIGIIGFSSGNTTVVNSGSISGGLSGTNVLTSRANAIQFYGSGNTLKLENGYSFVGNIIGGGSDTLTLGGATDSSFDLSQIVNTAPSAYTTPKYYGFSTFTKTDNSTWTLIKSTVPTVLTPWAVSAGTLQLGDGTTDGNITGNVSIALSATLAFNNINLLAYSNIISGNGNLTKTNTGKLTLSGINTHAGITTINDGTLALSGSGSLASSSNVITNATFDISGTTSGTTIKALNGSGSVDLGSKFLTVGDGSNYNSAFGGVISGTGGLTKAGTGTLTLSGANTYTGATAVSAGTLLLTGSLGGNITNNGFLIFNRSDDSYYNGVISGNGTVTKSGVGILTLSGDSSAFTGMTTVNAGELKLIDANSKLGGDITVNSNATISGNGTTGDLIIDIGGFIAPGNSIGTLTVAGDYTQNGTYNCEVNAVTGIPVAGTDNDLIAVTGNATLGGTLHVIPSGIFANGQSITYTVLTSTGLGGSSFASVTGVSPLFTYQANYTGTDAQLILTKTHTIAEIVTTGNLGSVASYMDNHAPAALEARLNALTTEQLQQALSDLDPAEETQKTDFIASIESASMSTPFTWSGMDRMAKQSGTAMAGLVQQLAP
ncbi:MAG: autotransporter-associated beta strand repeat-containing protein [Candidatus Paracaedibacteraceae bacterium]|nr:autotransporter-associated beta strand repeat-containing protein [Candidatus Paracaedibacteraceae bacterium]